MPNSLWFLYCDCDCFLLITYLSLFEYKSLLLYNNLLFLVFTLFAFNLLSREGSTFILSSLKDILQVPQRNLHWLDCSVGSPSLPHRQNLSSSCLHTLLGLPSLTFTQSQQKSIALVSYLLCSWLDLTLSLGVRREPSQLLSPPLCPDLVVQVLAEDEGQTSHQQRQLAQRHAAAPLLSAGLVLSFVDREEKVWSHAWLVSDRNIACWDKDHQKIIILTVEITEYAKKKNICGLFL